MPHGREASGGLARGYSATFSRQARPPLRDAWRIRGLWRSALVSSRDVLPVLHGLRPSFFSHSSSPPRGLDGAGFRSLSVEDESTLAVLLVSRPRQIPRYLRLCMLRPCGRLPFFRSSLTFLMILLQSNLQRKAISPADATALVVGIMRECAELRQGGMAHLLFRASLRFRKYGLEVGFPLVKYLYESQRLEPARCLMRSMADELRREAPLNFLAVLAYHLGGAHERAVELFKEIPSMSLCTANYCALIDSLGISGRFEDIVNLVSALLLERSKCNLKEIRMDEIFSCAIVALRGDQFRMKYMMGVALKEGPGTLSDAALGVILRVKLNEVHLNSVDDVYSVESKLSHEIGVASLGLLADTAVISRCSELIARGHGHGDEILLSKVKKLKSFLQKSLSGDNSDDLDSLYAYSVIKGFGALGDLAEMRRCFDELQLTTVSKNYRLYDEMLKWYAHSCNVNEVIALKKLMSERGIQHTSYTYHNLFKVLDRYYPRMVEEYYAEMRSKGIALENSTYPTLLRVFSELQNHLAVEGLYSELKEKVSKGDSQALSPAAAIQMIKCFQHDPVRCDAIIFEFEGYGLLGYDGVQAAIAQYYALHDRQVERRVIGNNVGDRYREAFREAARRRDRLAFQKLLSSLRAEGVQLSENLLALIISGLSYFNDASSVQKYFEEAIAGGMVRRPGFYAEVAAAYARMGDAEGVNRTWRALLQSRLVITMPVCNRFLNLSMSLNDVLIVQEILNTMMKLMPPNSTMATTVVEMLGRMGRLEEMQEVFDEMVKSPNIAPTIRTYHCAMEAYAKCGDIMKLEMLREKMKAQGFEENHTTFNILFEGYGRSKRYEHLRELLTERKAKKIPMEENCYVLLLNIYARARMPNETESLVEDIIESSTPLTSRLTAAIAVSFATVGNIEKMGRYVLLLLAIPKPRLRDIESVYLMFARIRDVVRIQELLDSDKLPKSELIYNICVSAFARAGERSKVAYLLTQMEEKGYKLSRSSNMILSRLLLKSGRVDLARELLQGNQEDPIVSESDTTEENTEKDS